MHLNNKLHLSNQLKHNELIIENKNEFGCYIFHNNNLNDKGILEDILLEMISKNNEKILSNSKNYLTENKISEERQHEYICKKEEERYDTKNKYEEKKSIISVAGQLQFSGMNNSVIIAKRYFG